MKPNCSYPRNPKTTNDLKMQTQSPVGQNRHNTSVGRGASMSQVSPLDGACGGAQVSLLCRIIKGTFWLCHILHPQNRSTSKPPGAFTDGHGTVESPPEIP